MPVSNGFLTLRYEQNGRPGMALGRNQELDARSLNYLAPVAIEIKPAEWKPAITTLNQGDVGSCTGNAGSYHLSNLYADHLADRRQR